MCVDGDDDDDADAAGNTDAAALQRGAAQRIAPAYCVHVLLLMMILFDDIIDN
jgi:hypothetical protein